MAPSWIYASAKGKGIRDRKGKVKERVRSIFTFWSKLTPLILLPNVHVK